MAKKTELIGVNIVGPGGGDETDRAIRAAQAAKAAEKPEKYEVKIEETPGGGTKQTFSSKK